MAMAARVIARRSQALDDSDPLSIHPPIIETFEERSIRLAKEQHEKEISDSIDTEIDKTRAQLKRGPKPVKILLLGQSESGKSTTLKNFQLMHNPKAFRAERASWRAVIQLNVVQSIRIITEAIVRVEKHAPRSNSTSPQSPSKLYALLTPELLGTKQRLQPLQDVEQNLIRRLTTAGSSDADGVQRSKTGLAITIPDASNPSKRVFKELAINSAIPWKTAFNLLTKHGQKDSFDGADEIDWDDPDDPSAILHRLADEMISLWKSPNVKALLEKQHIQSEELSEFFLDELPRVTAVRYVPTDDDILHARLKTLGVSEYLFRIFSGGAVRDWKIYDVGGHRSQRATWAPYFDDMDAIIFLAPISCFDQVLEEDYRVNRLEDSFKLWTMIVTNKLLENINLILFLNKIDILRCKLSSGIKLKDYVVSYGDRPNDFINTSNYFKRKFGGILQERSPSPRIFYCHLTTVTDTKSTKYILTNLQDMLIRQYLTKTDLIA